MRFIRPRRLLAGFRVDFDDDPRSPLRQAGEQWLPQDRKILSHVNDGWELLYQAKGRTDWKQGGRTFTVPHGGYYLIAPGTHHELLRCRGAEIHVYYAVFDPLRALSPSDRFLTDCWPSTFRAGPGAHTLAAPFQALMREVTLEPCSHTGTGIHLSALCLELHRLLNAPPERSREAAIHPAALRARECLSSHPGHAWKLDELAALCGVSVPHLIDLFRKEYGETPKQFLLRHRLERATELLRQGDLSVTEIAMEYGFSTSQHFANTFRRHFGYPPSKVRS